MRVALQHMDGAVERAVIYRMDVKIRKGLREYAIESTCKVALDVVARKNNGYFAAGSRTYGHCFRRQGCKAWGRLICGCHGKLMLFE